jgi:hypothetical protein
MQGGNIISARPDDFEPIAPDWVAMAGTGKHQGQKESARPRGSGHVDRYKPDRGKLGRTRARGDAPHAARANILHTLPPVFFKVER